MKGAGFHSGSSYAESAPPIIDGAAGFAVVSASTDDGATTIVTRSTSINNKPLPRMRGGEPPGIRHWGVSNLDVDDMAELVAAGGSACATDQILYNLTRRGPELDLLLWLADRGMPVMAYSPVEQGRLVHDDRLAGIATRCGATPAQVALAWTLRQARFRRLSARRS